MIQMGIVASGDEDVNYTGVVGGTGQPGSTDSGEDQQSSATGSPRHTNSGIIAGRGVRVTVNGRQTG